ncbi:MAG: DUF4446 family protein [Armatimonadetes bacterium]|nr:DUF4446 family protein [Armatimonadota bacterium]
MDQLQPYLAPLCVAALGLNLVLFVWVALLNKRLERQTRMVRQFFQGPNNEDMEGLLRRSMEVAEKSVQHCDASDTQMRILTDQLRASLQRFALVRYDAFPDVTGQQSFSLALLDGNDYGVVITAIFGRSSSRTFGKMIVAGQAEQPLSDEEQDALSQALAGSFGDSRSKVK